MLSMVKMLLEGEVGGHALNSHGNYIVDHGESWKNHGIVFLKLCGNPGTCPSGLVTYNFTPPLNTRSPLKEYAIKNLRE